MSWHRAVIYIAAESWDKIDRRTLRRLWKKLRPSVGNLPDEKIEKEEKDK